MNIAQRLKEEGLEEGMQKGRQEGMQRGIQQTAYNMLKDGMPTETIKRYTGLSDSDIKQLKNDIDS